MDCVFKTLQIHLLHRKFWLKTSAEFQISVKATVSVINFPVSFLAISMDFIIKEKGIGDWRQKWLWQCRLAFSFFKCQVIHFVFLFRLCTNTIAFRNPKVAFYWVWIIKGTEECGDVELFLTQASRKLVLSWFSRFLYIWKIKLQFEISAWTLYLSILCVLWIDNLIFPSYFILPYIFTFNFKKIVNVGEKPLQDGNDD